VVKFEAILNQFAQMGEKTGWTYIEVPSAVADRLKPNNKKSFRVKGSLDKLPIKSVALIPMGGGNFIMAVNSSMRKSLGKRKGASILVQISPDLEKIPLSAELLACLNDEPQAQKFFQSLAPSHQLYFSKWIETAKTLTTKTRRLSMAVNALSRSMNYGQMLRLFKADDISSRPRT